MPSAAAGRLWHKYRPNNVHLLCFKILSNFIKITVLSTPHCSIQHDQATNTYLGTVF